MGRRVIALIAAVVLALVGAVLVLLYARGHDDQPRALGMDAERGGLIKRTQVAAKAKPAGALASIDADNSALVALSDISPGQVILAAAFGTERLGQKAIDVPAGKIAISVSLEDPDRVGAFVVPGSTITMFDTYDITKLGTDDATKQYNELKVKGTAVLLTKIQVIGIGTSSLSGATQTPAAEGDSGNSAPTTNTPVQSYLVTVAVTPAESIRLVHAIQHSQNLQNNPAKHIYFGLDGPDTTVDPKLATDDFRYHGTP